MENVKELAFRLSIAFMTYMSGEEFERLYEEMKKRESNATNANKYWLTIAEKIIEDLSINL